MVYKIFFVDKIYKTLQIESRGKKQDGQVGSSGIVFQRLCFTKGGKNTMDVKTDREVEIVAILRSATIQLMGWPSPGMSYREWKKKEKILDRMLWDKSVELEEGITADDIEWSRVVKDWMKGELKPREHYITEERR
jgi:hypothetical protein